MNFSEQLLILPASLFCSAVTADDDDDNNNTSSDCPEKCPNCGRGCTKAAGHRMPHYCSVDKAWT